MYMEATTGGRVIQGVCKVGGVRKDITPEKLDGMLRGLKDMEPQLRDLTNVFLNDASVSHRLKGIGVLGKEDAYYLGAVGPTARGSGVGIDIRQTGYAAYGKINFKPVVEHSGDSYARCAVRAKETLHLDRYHRTVRKEDPRGTGRGKSGGGPERRVFLPRRAAPGRGRPLHQGERQAKPRPAPGADTDVYEHPAAADNAEGLRTGRRADHRAVDRPLYRLFGEVNEAMTYFEMTKTMVKSLFSRPATWMYPGKTGEEDPPLPGARHDQPGRAASPAGPASASARLRPSAWRSRRRPGRLTGCAALSATAVSRSAPRSASRWTPSTHRRRPLMPGCTRCR